MQTFPVLVLSICSIGDPEVQPPGRTSSHKTVELSSGADYEVIGRLEALAIENRIAHASQVSEGRYGIQILSFSDGELQSDTFVQTPSICTRVCWISASEVAAYLPASKQVVLADISGITKVVSEVRDNVLLAASETIGVLGVSENAAFYGRGGVELFGVRHAPESHTVKRIARMSPSPGSSPLVAHWSSTSSSASGAIVVDDNACDGRILTSLLATLDGRSLVRANIYDDGFLEIDSALSAGQLKEHVEGGLGTHSDLYIVWIAVEPRRDEFFVGTSTGAIFSGRLASMRQTRVPLSVVVEGAATSSNHPCVHDGKLVYIKARSARRGFGEVAVVDLETGSEKTLKFSCPVKFPRIIPGLIVARSNENKVVFIENE